MIINISQGNSISSHAKTRGPQNDKKDKKRNVFQLIKHPNEKIVEDRQTPELNEELEADGPLTPVSNAQLNLKSATKNDKPSTKKDLKQSKKMALENSMDTIPAVDSENDMKSDG